MGKREIQRQKDREAAREARAAPEAGKLSATVENAPLPKEVLTLAEKVAAAEEAGKPLTSLSTFSLLGRTLPIGYLHGGRLHRNFALRPFKMKEERALQALRAKKGSIGMAEFVSEVLSFMLTEFGPWSDFSTLSEAERKLVISQLYMADVMYMYVQLRIEAIGEDVTFKLQCPACRHSWKFTADLAETDVVVSETADLAWRHDLRSPIKTARGEVSQLVIQPPRWSAMTSVRPTREGVNHGDVKLHLIASAVRHPLGMPDFALSVADLEELTKRDLEKLTRTVDEDSPGADLELEADCPSCNHHFSHALNWSWDFFFTASSL